MMHRQDSASAEQIHTVVNVTSVNPVSGISPIVNAANAMGTQMYVTPAQELAAIAETQHLVTIVTGDCYHYFHLGNGK